MTVYLCQLAMNVLAHLQCNCLDGIFVPSSDAQNHLQISCRCCHGNAFDKVQQAINDIVASGYSATIVISQLHDALVLAPTGEVPDAAKARIAEALARADKALADGADEELQLLHLGAFVMQQLGKSA